MRYLYSVTLAAAALHLSGCSSASDSISDSAAGRTATVAGVGAGAAGIGYAASDGNAGVTAAAGLGGAALAMGALGDDSEYGRKMMAKGVNYGMQVETKRLYFAMLNASQKPKSRTNQQLRYYEVNIPPRTIDGITFEGERIVVPIFDAVTPAATGAVGNPALGTMVDGQTDVLRENSDPLAVPSPAAPVVNETGR